jgi:hypothetical protein
VSPITADSSIDVSPSKLAAADQHLGQKRETNELVGFETSAHAEQEISLLSGDFVSPTWALQGRIFPFLYSIMIFLSLTNLINGPHH